MVHSIVRLLQLLSILGCVSSVSYYALCLWSARAFVRTSETAGRKRSAEFHSPVSILKPLKGIDPEIYESFRSHCLQDYPEYEIVFGVSDVADPAVASVEQLQREFPERSIRLVVCPDILGPNVKVSNLEHMAKAARYEFLIVNDSDIRVEKGYLREMMPPFAEPDVGMVTCLYRGVAESTFGSRLESLGISTDFCAGVLVARWLEGGLHFGLGSTMAFRQRDLERIGGFKAIVDFLADDYELGRRIAELGREVILSDVVVETHLPAYDFQSFVAHQMRWARGVRDARLGGYIGLGSTFGVLWALLTVIFSRAASWSWIVLGVVLLLRLLVAAIVGRGILRDRQVFRDVWLLPARDLITAGLWVISFWGHTVSWRGERFELRKGRLHRI